MSAPDAHSVGRFDALRSDSENFSEAIDRKQFRSLRNEFAGIDPRFTHAAPIDILREAPARSAIDRMGESTPNTVVMPINAEDRSMQVRMQRRSGCCDVLLISCFEPNRPAFCVVRSIASAMEVGDAR